MRLLPPLLAFASPLAALDLDFGLKAGVPVTAYFETGRNPAAEYSAATRRYTLGASVEWRATRGLGVGFEALYHRMGYVAIVTVREAAEQKTSAVDVKGHSFDFPLRARWYPRTAGPLFLTGGFLIRYAGPVRGRGERIVENLITGSVTRAPIDTTEPPELSKRFYPGLTAGAGVTLGRGRLHLVPEFRFTRWTANLNATAGLLRFSANQVEILVGFEFP